jgi:hypothetical protein
MKRLFLVLIILTASLWWLNSCDSGVNSNPYSYVQTPTDPAVDSYSQQVNGEIRYDIFFPEWEKGLHQDWTDIGKQIGDGPITILGPATDRVGYRWSITTVDGNFYVHIGRHKRFGPDKVEWANINNIPQKWLRHKNGQPCIAFTLRGGRMDTIVEPPLIQLKANIMVSTHETATGNNISFDGSQSTSSANPKSEIIIWSWDFGDGATAIGKTASHAYQLPGTYTVFLTVTDDFGNTNTAQTVISVVATAAPGEIGDNIQRFHFDFLRNVVQVFYNFNKAKGNFVGKPNAYGNYDGVDVAWRLAFVGHALTFDLFHEGWGYVEIPLSKPIIALKSGFSQWYEGSMDRPDFSLSNFDHMKDCIYFNGQDLSNLIYSSGQIQKGP